MHLAWEAHRHFTMLDPECFEKSGQRRYAESEMKREIFSLKRLFFVAADCFARHESTVVPARTLLSQLL